MIHLIKLELKKLKIGGYIKSASIATLIIFGLLSLMVYISKVEGDPIFSIYAGLFEGMTVIINCTFMIFAGVLLARTVIDEYKNKTIQVLFGYPISRKKLILAKILLVVIFTFSAIVLSNSLMLLGFYIIQIIHPVIQQTLTFELVLNQIESTISSGALISMMSLIPLYFGLRKKSVPTTIVSSIIIALIINSDGNGFRLSSITIIPIILAIVGVVLTYIAIMKDIEQKDI